MCSLAIAPPVDAPPVVAKTKFSAVDAAHVALARLPGNLVGGSRG